MRSVVNSVRSLGSSIRGVAMIEFALLLPVLIVVLFGTAEVTQVVIAKRRLSILVYTLGDLTSQSQTISSSDISDIFGASQSIMSPLNITGLQMRISSIIVYAGGNTCVDWSTANGTGISPLQAGSTAYQMPAVITASSSTTSRDFIVAEATLPLKLNTHGFLKSTFTLHEGPTYIIPRQSTRVTADTSIQASSPCAS